ncbi:MAG TPA: AraC family transcriptional regulator [Microscillaceae bacterium]|nr:AraC family transcriptional regulator [Microscillaceae bacterium]
MKNISILLPFGNHSISLSSTVTILDIAQRSGCALSYQIVSANNKQPVQMGPFRVTPDMTIREVKQTDLIIISPLIFIDNQAILDENRALIEWVRHLYQRGSEVISLCTGAYILAATGLLAHKEASSHVSAIADLQRRYPAVTWRKEKIITDQEGLMTSGGALSSLNVLIYWLMKYYDKSTVRRIAKGLQIDYPRESQKPFYIFSNQKNHTDELILQIQEYLEEHQGEAIHFDELAHKYHISRRSLNRRFKNATGESLRTYQQRVLIEKAKEYLEAKPITIQELAYTLGYVDVNSFRNLFHKITGTLPHEYQRRFLAK